MNLLQTIINYYHGEAKHGFWMAFIGGLLLIGGFVLWKWAVPLSLLKGFTVPMFLFGLLVGIGGAADGFYTRKITPGKMELYQKDPTTFLKQEKVKIEKTHRGWHGIRIMWCILGLSGVLLSLLIRKPFWIGAGLGTVGLAIIISLFELFSMRFNERYYHAIITANPNKASFNKQEMHNDAQQQPVKLQQTMTALKMNEQKRIKPASDTLRSQILPLDSLKNISASNIITSVNTDSIRLNIPNSLQQPTLYTETAQIDPVNKKRKVLDYYNSDLIQSNSVNARHCWFSKKYIKN